MAEEILAAGDADLVGMVRANIADPRLLPKSMADAPKTVRPCIGANVCINALLDHKTLTCMVNPELGRPLSTIDRPIGAARSALLIGAGPAGLEAARRLALRGFSTRLIEARDRVGGQMERWSQTPSRQEFLKAVRWWEDELERLGIDVALETTADVAEIMRHRPSVVMLATGSTPIVQGSADLAGTPVFGPYDVPASGGHVLVQDEIGRLSAMLTAERLAAGWRRVTLVTSAMHPGEGEGVTTAYTLLRALGRAGVEIVDRSKLVSVRDGRAVLSGVFDEARPVIEGVDAVVPLLGAVSHIPLAAELQAAGATVHRIGDAKLPRDVTAAVKDAADTVWSLDVHNSAGTPSESLSHSVAATLS
ncbi:hypothetical protein VQ03_02375 [Methylobacterium tarhaniae]|uniref:FAD/NAD(P)-binding domain-containing protein n=2 Tax=Methylobacterium tarhaniae TaxID=1187852 RepID=A0A0J6TFD4_9HYPH|nr:hypothetical protein VQ03_02375 [Methylobacterium tarhaniae]